MPQLTQLPDIFWSQLFWLVVVFAATFFVVGRGMLPKVQSTVDLREARIAEDLERAQAARVAADETEAAWRARMDSARADAARIAQEAKQASAAEAEAKVKKAADKLARKAEASEKRIGEAVAAARSEIETIAAELTQDLVSRLTGIKVETKAAAEAVKAEMNV